MLEAAMEMKRQYVDSLLGKKNVVACGVGYKETGGVKTDEPCVVVSVTKKVPMAQLSPGDLVPQALGEVKTDVQETGVIRALQSRTDKWRPAPGGVSIGHMGVTAGTLGCLVSRDDQLFILSNNHVLAASNEGQVGDPILQPGCYDRGMAEDRIAVLEDFVPINFGTEEPTCPIARETGNALNYVAQALGSRHRLAVFQENPLLNLVDAAIALPLSAHLVEKRILEIGVPKGSREGALGLQIKKSGRTTALTRGEITQVDVTVQVRYDNRVATFTDQLMAGGMSKGGDSGSAVLDEDDFVIGLLFAGSETATVINRIQHVLEAFGITITT